MASSTDFLYNDLIVFNKLAQVSNLSIKNNIEYTYINNQLTGPAIVFLNVVWDVTERYRSRLHKILNSLSVDAFYFNIGKVSEIGDEYTNHLD